MTTVTTTPETTTTALSVPRLLALAMGALSNLRASSLVNAWTGAALLAIGLYGLFVIGSEANILSLNSAGNVLNFGAAAVLLAAGLGADQGVPATAGDVVDHA